MDLIVTFLVWTGGDCCVAVVVAVAVGGSKMGLLVRLAFSTGILPLTAVEDVSFSAEEGALRLAIDCGEENIGVITISTD